MKPRAGPALGVMDKNSENEQQEQDTSNMQYAPTLNPAPFAASSRRWGGILGDLTLRLYMFLLVRHFYDGESGAR